MSSPHVSITNPLPFVVGRSPHQTHSQGSRSSDGGRPSSSQSFTHPQFATAYQAAASPMNAPHSAPAQHPSNMANSTSFMDVDPISGGEDHGYVPALIDHDFEGIPASPEEMMPEESSANQAGGKDEAAALAETKDWMEGLAQHERENSVQMAEFGAHSASEQTLTTPINIPGSQSTTPTGPGPQGFTTSAARGEMPPPISTSRPAGRSESRSPTEGAPNATDGSPTRPSAAATGPRPLPTGTYHPQSFPNAAPYSSGFNPQPQGARFRGKSMSGPHPQAGSSPYSLNFMPGANGTMQPVGSTGFNHGATSGSLPRAIGGQEQGYQTVSAGWDIRPPPLSSSSSTTATTPGTAAVFANAHFGDHRTPHTASTNGPASSFDSLNTSSSASSFFANQQPGAEYPSDPFGDKGMVNITGSSYDPKHQGGQMQQPQTFPNQGHHFGMMHSSRPDLTHVRSGLGQFSLQGHQGQEDVKPMIPQSMPTYMYRPPSEMGQISSDQYDPHHPHEESPMTFAMNKNPRKHVCRVCDKRFNRPSSLQTHMSVHTGAKPYQCPRHDCGRRFSVSSNLRRHMRTHEARQQKRMEALRLNREHQERDGFDDLHEQDELDEETRRSPQMGGMFRQEQQQAPQQQQQQFGGYQTVEYGNQFNQGPSTPQPQSAAAQPQLFPINPTQLGNAGLSMSPYPSPARPGQPQSYPMQRSLMLGPGTPQMQSQPLMSASSYTSKNQVRMGPSGFGSGKPVFTQQPLGGHRPLPSGM